MTGALILRTVLAVVAWWALAEGVAPRGAGWAVAAVAVAAAVLAGLVLRRPGGRRPRLGRLPRFAWFFLDRSVVGGIDVAWRALAPRGRVRPGFLEVRTRLPEGTPRALFLEVVSVMPGTLVVEDVGGGVVRVHVIDTTLPARDGLERVEAEIAALFPERGSGG